MSNSNKPILGYWDIRGLGQPIRLLLAYLGIEFDEKRYVCGPDFDRSQWLTEKFNLGLDFPNLPYYIDGQVKMTHSLAIMRYLGEKHGLAGANEQERRRIWMATEQARDLVYAKGMIAYDEQCEQKKPEFIEKLPDALKLLDEFIGDHFITGTDSISYGDFYVYEYLCKVKVMVPEVFQRFQHLQNYHKRIETLPAVAEYLKQHPQPLLFYLAIAKWNASYA